MFTCPQDGCVKVFQRLSSLEKHLSLEKCTESLEKRSLLDLAKLGYKSRLEEGTTSQVISSASFRDTREATSGEVEVKEGWALKPSKKAYRFNQNQRDYLNAKFTIGQTSGRNGVLTSPQRLLPEVNHSPFVLAGITKSRKNLFCSLFWFLCLFLKFVYV